MKKKNLRERERNNLICVGNVQNEIENCKFIVRGAMKGLRKSDIKIDSSREMKR